LNPASIPLPRNALRFVFRIASRVASSATILRMISRRETGSVSPDKFGGYKTFTLEPHTDRVKELVAEQPDSTLAELQVRLAKEKVNVSQSGISRFLHHINLTFKKKRPGPCCERRCCAWFVYGCIGCRCPTCTRILQALRTRSGVYSAKVLCGPYVRSERAASVLLRQPGPIRLSAWIAGLMS